MSLFSVVRFTNSACTGDNSYNGTCYTSTECTSYGGTASGTCASGFGVCCIGAYHHIALIRSFFFLASHRIKNMHHPVDFISDNHYMRDDYGSQQYLLAESGLQRHLFIGWTVHSLRDKELFGHLPIEVPGNKIWNSEYLKVLFLTHFLSFLLLMSVRIDWISKRSV